jgi:hypothetical protein
MHTLDNVHVEPVPEIQEEQVQEVLGGPQTPNYEETNLPFS